MPALDFPSSPTNGQIYEQYTYDSAKGAWRVAANPAATVVSSPTAPASPVSGNLWLNTNDGVLFVYYNDGDTSQWVEVKSNTASGSTVAARVDALEAYPSGLVPVIPTSVVVGSGSATVNANGKVSFSGATSISLNGVFTESYTRYKINFVGRVAVGTAGVDFYAKFRRNNSDISAGYYGSAIYNAYNASLTNAAQFNNTASGFIGYIGNLEGSLSTIEIATSSTFSGWSMHCRNTSAASQHIGGFNTTTSSGVDGFTIYPVSSTMTGTFQVYGYN